MLIKFKDTKIFQFFEIINRVKQSKVLFFLVGMMIVAAILEILGIGCAIPILHLILSQDSSEISLRSFHIKRDTILLAIVLIFLLKNLLNLIILFFQTALLQKLRHRISAKLFETYLFMPYLAYLEKNTSYFIYLCFGQVNEFVHTYATALCTLISEIFVLMGIAIFLMVLSPKITLIGGAFLVGVSYIFSKLTKQNLKNSGECREKMGVLIFKFIKEGLESLKEIRIFASEQYFIRRFETGSQIFSKAHSQGFILQNSTKLVFEVIMIFFLVGGVFFAKKMHIEGAYLLSLMAVFATATLRIMPSFNRITNSIATMRSTEASLDSICAELKQVQIPVASDFSELLSFNYSLRVSNITFTYPGKDSQALKNVSFEVEKGMHVGVVGKSGAGKSTLVDILLGLVNPNLGDICIDGISIGSTSKEWRHLIGYVPQLMSLLDESITQNIAFGIAQDKVNFERLEKVIEQVCLTEFVNNLPEGLSTIIGDRGIKISGGQRQRIAIARALYRDPDILIFDEATSALDMETEHLITQELFKIGKNKTLIVVAHRLSTIKQCDLLLLMEDGAIVDRGTFDELTARNKWFSDIQKLSLDQKNVDIENLIL